MPHGEKGRKSSHRSTKKLGRVAQAAVAHNDELGEAYVEAVKAGLPTHLLGGVAMADPGSSHPGTVSFGDGLFSIRLNDGSFIRATTRGMVTLRGRVRFNPAVATAIHDGTPVVVEDMGLRVGVATHRIVAVLTPAQANAARPVARSSSRGSNSIFARRSSSTRRANAEIRAAAVAALNRTRTAAQRAEFLRIASGAVGPAVNVENI
jgi:hypothetical protein